MTKASRLIELLSQLPGDSEVITDPDDGAPRLEVPAKCGCLLSPWGYELGAIAERAIEIMDHPGICETEEEDWVCESESGTWGCESCGHSCGKETV